MTRLLVLTLGPPLLACAVYALSFSSSRRHAAATETPRVDPAPIRVPAADDGLDRACREVADKLLADLPDSCRVVIRPPFVLAGDISESALDRLHAETVRPVTDALWRSYFDRRPDLPVIIVALENEAGYRAAAARLDGYEPLAYAGYTQRGQRRIVCNL